MFAPCAEMERVKAVGGWIEDGRVCDMIAVSRAFGDPDFKGEGMAGMLARGVKCASFGTTRQHSPC